MGHQQVTNDHINIDTLKAGDDTISERRMISWTSLQEQEIEDVYIEQLKYVLHQQRDDSPRIQTTDLENQVVQDRRRIS